jgi:hypothetical protein
MNAPLRSTPIDVGVAAIRESYRVRERELLRVAGELTGSNPAASALAAQREVLEWAALQVGDKLPAKALEGPPFEHLRGGRVCLGTGFDDDTRSLWAVRVDRPDVQIAQRTWTTELVIGYPKAGGSTLFSLRLLASSPEPQLRVSPAVPGIVRRIADKCGLQQGGRQIAQSPWIIATDEDAQELVASLLDTSRAIPYIVCSIAEGESGPAVDASVLAKVTLGIARVVIVPADFTWVLTQQLGKPLSVFNGAIRAYLPGFSFDANPYSHRLFLTDRTADDDRVKSTVTALRWIAANESVRRFQLGQDVLAFSAVREASLDVARARLQQSGTASSEQLATAHAQIDALKDDVRRSTEAQQWLSDEHKAAEEKAETLEQQLRGAQYRVQQLLEQIKARGEAPDADVRLPENWEAFPDWCDSILSGRVVLSGRARRDIKSAAFSDPPTAARCLLWLANEYRDSRMNGSSGDLRKPIEEGIYNDRCGADSFDFEWGDRDVRVEWHIKNGGNTRDPRRCLRVYYFWDDERQLVVIATMPAHIRTGAT